MVMIKWMFRYLNKYIFSLPTRTFALVSVVLLAFVPLFTNEPYILRLFILVNIFALYAASWDFLSGYVGQTNFGHALFFGVAAYGSAIINLKTGWSPLLSIPLGALIAVGAGLLGALPALRLKGPYLALATFSLPVILQGIIFIFPHETGGEQGLSGITRLAGSRTMEYYISFVVMIAIVIIIKKLTDSKMGIIFHAIKEDEIAARASGINTTKYKVMAFCISGMIAGIAGGLFTHFMRIAGPSNLEMFMSFQPVIWTIFGGTVTIYGPVVGVYILVPLMEMLHVVPQVRMIIFAFILILILRFMPQGLTPWIEDRLEKVCPRCKGRNAFIRKDCRICSADLE